MPTKPSGSSLGETPTAGMIPWVDNGKFKRGFGLLGAGAKRADDVALFVDSALSAPFLVLPCLMDDQPSAAGLTIWLA